MRLLYISQGNIPSKWAHTFQAMKMAEALSLRVKSFTLLTGSSIIPSFSKVIDLQEWYGIESFFKVRRLPFCLHMPEPYFSHWCYPLFDRLSAIYARITRPDLIYTRSPGAAFHCIRYGLPLIIETHMETHDPEFQTIIEITRSLYTKLLITVTHYLKDEYIAGGVPVNKILVWPDAVDLARYTNTAYDAIAIRNKLGIPTNKKIAMYCGHFYETKGVQYLIEAARFLPDVSWVLIGGWPEDIARCRALANGCNAIQFIGFVPNQKVPCYLSAADFLLLPTSGRFHHAKATSPLKMFEYMAARKPIIASDLPAFNGYLRHLHNAFLVEPDSAEKIVAAIRQLLKNPQQAHALAEEGWKTVQQYTWGRRASDILEMAGRRASA